MYRHASASVGASLSISVLNRSEIAMVLDRPIVLTADRYSRTILSNEDCTYRIVTLALERKEKRMPSHRHDTVYVVQHGDEWAVKKPNAERASAVLPTQREAIERAKELAGKGSIHIQGRDGKYRTITPFEE